MNQVGKPLNYPIITGRPDQTARPATKQPSQITNLPGASFGDLLKQSIQERKSGEITFSKHAQARTVQRGIEITAEDLERLNGAVGKAEDKGLTDTLVLMDEMAFIINVPSRVVVTVVDGSGSEENVFTNIDGAVVL